MNLFDKYEIKIEFGVVVRSIWHVWMIEIKKAMRMAMGPSHLSGAGSSSHNPPRLPQKEKEQHRKPKEWAVTHYIMYFILLGIIILTKIDCTVCN